MSYLHGVPWCRKSVKGHQVMLDRVGSAREAAVFGLQQYRWFVHHDQAVSQGAAPEATNWIPVGMERFYVQGDERFQAADIAPTAMKLGATKVFRIKDWVIWVFPHTSDARRALPALSGAVHTVDNEGGNELTARGNCLVTRFGGG